MAEADGEEVFDLRTVRLRAEREAIERALTRSKGSVSGAARLLGVSRPTLYGLLETHGMAISRQGQDGQEGQDGAEPPEATLDAV
jgi:two-component system NtrC family response regulator